MNPYLIAVLVLIVLDYALELVSAILTLRHMQNVPPGEFSDCCDAGQYARSQDYLRTNVRFEILHSSLKPPLMILFILLGGFALVHSHALAAGFGMIGTGLLFAGALVLLDSLIEWPFDIYSTFVIEEKYGFNRTTGRTFILDKLKGIALGALIGGPVFALTLWFFAACGSLAWLYAWAALSIIHLLLATIAPVLLLPLFNKFVPLEEGELRQAIASYAQANRFKLGGIFKIDGSRRSSKTNAYFTGLGRWRRIALFDTLIEKHSIPELLAVLAHEVGHYKLGHIWKTLAASLLTNGLVFYLLSLFLGQAGLYEAFGVAFEPVGGHMPLYAGFLFFGFLLSPIMLLLSIAGNLLSRRHEYQADAYAARTTSAPRELVAALKKLSIDNMSNLNPHPFNVFLHYSHPPVLQRIRALLAMDHQA